MKRLKRADWHFPCPERGGSVKVLDKDKMLHGIMMHFENFW